MIYHIFKMHLNKTENPSEPPPPNPQFRPLPNAKSWITPWLILHLKKNIFLVPKYVEMKIIKAKTFFHYSIHDINIPHDGSGYYWHVQQHRYNTQSVSWPSLGNDKHFFGMIMVFWRHNFRYMLIIISLSYIHRISNSSFHLNT